MNGANSRAFDVLTVGEVLYDFMAPDADGISGATHFIRSPGGAPANAAVAVARLGGRSAVVGAVGDDAFGASLRETLVDASVDTSALLTLNARTTLAFVARNSGGIPDFLFYRGADALLAPEHIPPELVAQSRIVHLGSMALLSEPSRSATLRAAALAHAAGALVSVDPNLRPSSWPSTEAARLALQPLLVRADILKMNEVEAALLTADDRLERALERLGGKQTLVVITLGGDGCLWRLGDDGGRIASPSVDVVETTGAGDAFIGALLFRLAPECDESGLAGVRPASLTDSLRFATAAGALACTKPGAMASLPTESQVRALLAVQN